MWTGVARARLASTLARDRIMLNGLVFHGRHGHLPEERVLGQRFEVDIALSTDLRAAGASDELGDTVNYVAVFETARAHMTGPPCALIESLAGRIADDILRDHAAVAEARVCVRKPHVPIPNVLEHVAVEVVRSREGV